MGSKSGGRNCGRLAPIVSVNRAKSALIIKIVGSESHSYVYTPFCMIWDKCGTPYQKMEILMEARFHSPQKYPCLLKGELLIMGV